MAALALKLSNPDRLQEVISERLAIEAARTVRKISPEIMLCLVEDQLQTFGDDLPAIHEALGNRARSRERGSWAVIRRASPALLAKVLAAMVIQQSLGSEQSRAALLKACGVDAGQVELDVCRDWARGAWKQKPLRLVPELKPRIVTPQTEFKFVWSRVF